jgi:DNA-directed RNA polymerase specialized sigma24 family protein
VTSDPGGRSASARDRAPRLRPLAAALVEDVAAVDPGTPDSELLDRLADALARLPSAERAAVMTAYGYDEGSEAVAADLGLDTMDAEALSRNALQLLRGALADTEPDDRTQYPRLAARRTRGNTKAPD